MQHGRTARVFGSIVLSCWILYPPGKHVNACKLHAYHLEPWWRTITSCGPIWRDCQRSWVAYGTWSNTGGGIVTKWSFCLRHWCENDARVMRMNCTCTFNNETALTRWGFGAVEVVNHLLWLILSYYIWLFGKSFLHSMYLRMPIVC